MVMPLSVGAMSHIVVVVVLCGMCSFGSFGDRLRVLWLSIIYGVIVCDACGILLYHTAVLPFSM